MTMTREKVSVATLRKRLERRYHSFLDLDEAGFFRGVADYVKAILESPVFQKIIETDVEQERLKDRAAFDKLTDQLRKEVQEAARAILGEIQKRNIQSPALDEAVKEYDGYKTGRIQSSLHQEEGEYSELCGVVRVLNEMGLHDVAASFATLDESRLIKTYTFCPSYEAWDREKERLKERRDHTVWGSWLDLHLVYRVIHRWREEWQELQVRRDTLRILDLV